MMAAAEAVRALPVEPYVGLADTEASQRAAEEGRELRLLTSLDGPRRSDLRHHRLNVNVNHLGIVTGADAG